MGEALAKDKADAVAVNDKRGMPPTLSQGRVLPSPVSSLNTYLTWLATQFAKAHGSTGAHLHPRRETITGTPNRLDQVLVHIA